MKSTEDNPVRDSDVSATRRDNLEDCENHLAIERYGNVEPPKKKLLTVWDKESS